MPNFLQLDWAGLNASKPCRWWCGQQHGGGYKNAQDKITFLSRSEYPSSLTPQVNLRWQHYLLQVLCKRECRHGSFNVRWSSGSKAKRRGQILSFSSVRSVQNWGISDVWGRSIFQSKRDWNFYLSEKREGIKKPKLTWQYADWVLGCDYRCPQPANVGYEWHAR